LAVPGYQASVVKAKEAALRQDLFTIRDVLDQHRTDQGKYPASLQALVAMGYLRAIPTDPFTSSTSTWQEMTGSTEEGVIDIFSGSEFVGTNGTPYNRW
jgi:general secretion pathway protein G